MLKIGAILNTCGDEGRGNEETVTKGEGRKTLTYISRCVIDKIEMEKELSKNITELEAFERRRNKKENVSRKHTKRSTKK